MDITKISFAALCSLHPTTKAQILNQFKSAKDPTEILHGIHCFHLSNGVHWGGEGVGGFT